MSNMFSTSLNAPALICLIGLILLTSTTITCSPLGDSSISAASQQQTIIGQQQAAANSTASGPESDTSQVVNSPSQAQQQQQTNANVHQVAQPVQAQAAPAALPPKLPNINIFISKNEIRKLLGIDAKINYVTNGNINTYPFGFTIPLGYNQSDIIFTWQNLGPTNVNYSISLVIGNAEAVGPPLINITRIGLVPRHEQVFKITLPCSGKRTDEVDVQVLINISGMVPVETNNNDMISGDQEGTVSPAQDQLNADMQLASMTMARQQLATAQQMATGDININSTDGMQSDEAVQPMMRLVSHTLVIKRKKICTMHPVPIQPTPKVWPANQPTTRVPQVGPMHGDHPTAISTAPSTAMPPANKWQDIPAAPVPNKAPGGWPDNALHSRHQPPAQTSSEPSAEPSHHPSLSPPLDATLGLVDQTAHVASRPQAPLPPTRKPASSPNELGPGAFTYPNWPSRPIPQENPLATLMKQQQPQVPLQVAANGSNNPLMLTLIVMSLVISVALVVLLLLSSTSSSRKSRPLDKLNALTSCLLRRAPACSRVQTSRASKSSSSLSSAASNNSRLAHKHHGIIGSLRVPTIIGAHHHKASASSVSGLSAISGHSNFVNKQQAAAYYFGATATTTTTNKTGPTNYATGYYTIGNNQNNYNQQQQHHYQHPPTGDLLGTGYQCQPPPATPQFPSIHHIATGNTNQTTRLVWSQASAEGGGFAVDGGSYMRLSKAPRSDSGSVYQTIY